MSQFEVLRRLQGEPPTQAEIKAWIGQPPQLALVDFSKKCNLWCQRHCGYPQQQLRRERQESRGQTTEPLFIDAKTLKKAYDEIAVAWSPLKPALQISADGEPLLHPKRIELICYPSRELGLSVGLTTNGTLLTAELAEQFCNAGVKIINISLDAATEETYSIVRPERHGRANYFQKVIGNIARAVQIRNDLRSKGISVPTQFMITMIVRPEVTHEEEAFIQLGKELGVDKVSFRPLNTTAGLTPFNDGDKRFTTDKQGLITAVDEVPRHPCHFPFTRFSLTVAEGENVKFVFCPHAWDRTDADIGFYPAGGSLKEMWQSARLQEVRQWHLSGNFDPNGICAGCPDWRFVTGRDQTTYAKIVQGIKQPEYPPTPKLKSR